ncbi:hypothetical protein SKAU_G00397090 [Synaphobranchus kaupii]|uniref:Uncharacterized protein n=1 Tax=Synaphobranchus kaupii TaxID=118154 RepID=A0A9Q1E8B3_SYNKA|nr:hypothetical protein SKAU_G00397090 [Synaphobranchus kaupii]
MGPKLKGQTRVGRAGPEADPVPKPFWLFEERWVVQTHQHIQFGTCFFTALPTPHPAPPLFGRGQGM